jgi:hypothetical protein
MSAKASRRLRTQLIVVLILPALYTAYRYTLHRMVESKLDAIRQQGYPVTLAELDKWYPQPPPGENAVEVYQEAFAHNVKLGDEELLLPVVGHAKLPPRGEPLSQGMRESIAQYLKTNQESIALLHKATAMPYCRVVSHLSISKTSIVPGASDRWLAAHQLELEAIYAADSGDGGSAAAALVASLGLVRQFSKEPLADPWFAQQPYFGLASFALERALSRTQLDSNQLASVSSALAATESSVAIDHVLLGEFAWNNDVFSEIRQGREPAGPLLTMDFKGDSHNPGWRGLLLAIVYRLAGIEDFDQLNYLHLESIAILIAREPLAQRITTLNAFEQQVRGTSAQLPLSRLDSYVTCQYLRLDAKYIARLRVAQAGLSVESYRSEHGQLPDAPPSNLTDPFDGQPLRYKKLAKGYVVYSVGEDGKDDGGDEKKDITFTVER